MARVQYFSFLHTLPITGLLTSVKEERVTVIYDAVRRLGRDVHMCIPGPERVISPDHWEKP